MCLKKKRYKSVLKSVDPEVFGRQLVHGVKRTGCLLPNFSFGPALILLTWSPIPLSTPVTPFKYFLRILINFNCLFRSVPASRDVLLQNSQLQQQDESVVFLCHARFLSLFSPHRCVRFLLFALHPGLLLCLLPCPLPPLLYPAYLYQIYHLHLYSSLKILTDQLVFIKRASIKLTPIKPASIKLWPSSSSQVLRLDLPYEVPSWVSAEAQLHWRVPGIKHTSCTFSDGKICVRHEAHTKESEKGFISNGSFGLEAIFVRCPAARPVPTHSYFGRPVRYREDLKHGQGHFKWPDKRELRTQLCKNLQFKEIARKELCNMI